MDRFVEGFILILGFFSLIGLIVVSIAVAIPHLFEAIGPWPTLGGAVVLIAAIGGVLYAVGD